MASPTQSFPVVSGGKTVLLFGPQAYTLSAIDLKRLASLASATCEWEWVVDVLSRLSDCWAAFTKEHPEFSNNAVEGIPQHQHLADVTAWLEAGSIPDGVETRHLSNLIITPLVVLGQLLEYMAYLDTANGDSSVNKPTALGFCTGQLSAIAAALGKDRRALRRHGAAAVRLALLVGGVVDAQESISFQGKSTALATAWTSPEDSEKLQKILQVYPEAYISVSTDSTRATVTTAADTVDNLLQALQSAGISASELGFHGRFHCESHLEAWNVLSAYCNSKPYLSFPRAAADDDLSCSLYRCPASASDCADAGSVSFTSRVLRDILVDKLEWFETFQDAYRSWLLDDEADGSSGRLVLFGSKRCVPPSLAAKLGSRAVRATDLPAIKQLIDSSAAATASTSQRPVPRRPGNDIAVVGMAIKVAGAEGADEFWQILSNAESQHREMPAERFKADSAWRNVDPKRKWFGNFVAAPESFDHRFFKKTAREMASTDPAHRQLLQVVYQAVEQAGYFSRNSSSSSTEEQAQRAKVGCFIGSCIGDYEQNTACHDPNAFTAVGCLRAFAAGRVSHYFGWTGPSLAIDTACSSSLVAIHQACQSIRSGECTAAIAAGTNVMTTSLWFQNLAAASFLSPTGQCKPFDAAADGYCRGEGIVAVFLKDMTAAIADGDQIFGVVAATAVQQNENCTPIFVPDSGSLASLFGNVVNRAGLRPEQIGYVEAHGTGTPVGDPAEYKSIRSMLAGPAVPRTLAMPFGSVKGLVGHCEGASGAVSMIKSLLMLHHRSIPAQPSFRSLNPAIPALPTDNMEIVTQQRPWDLVDSDVRAVLINNYGASGSNASMVLTEVPTGSKVDSSLPAFPGSDGNSKLASVEYVFRICGSDDRAIKDYARRLLRFLASDYAEKYSLADLSYNICRQSNPTLPREFAFSSRSRQDLIDTLKSYAGDVTGASSPIASPRSPRPLASYERPAVLPVVFCFGGQISTFVGLDVEIYRSARVLRSHLHDADAACRALGAGSIFPGIFQRTPVEDPVALQTMLFACQYACARTWMDCGVKPAAMIGHSFGELTALCVSGSLGLADALRLIIGRATVIREHWGSDSGCMIAIQAEADTVERILAEANRRAGSDEPLSRIACFNGPRCYTVAGSSRGIDLVAEVIESKEYASVRDRTKRLSVSNAFHSALAEPLAGYLEKIGQELPFKEPAIPLEFATECPSPRTPGPNYVSDHMRNPVYFLHAMQRLEERYPSAVWLEAGSNSTVTSLASRAIGSPRGAHFQQVNITSAGGVGVQSLANATLNLWKLGNLVSHWAHHPLDANTYAPILMPPYQFDRAKHYMELTSPKVAVPVAAPAVAAEPVMDKKQRGFWDQVGFCDSQKRSIRFRINTESDEFLEAVTGHKLVSTAPICPATLQLDIVIEALLSVRGDLGLDDTWQPQVRDLSNQAAICLDASRSVWLDMDAVDERRSVWSWKMTSESKTPASSSRPVLHATGQALLVHAGDAQEQLEFARLARLETHQQCLSVLDGREGDEVIHGRTIYSFFKPVVDYGAAYRGLQKLVGNGGDSNRDMTSAGRVLKSHNGKTWLDPYLADCFCQVGGIFANCMTDCEPSEMYIATGIKRWFRSPAAAAATATAVRASAGRGKGSGEGLRAQETQTEWHVLAKHLRVSDQSILTDVFVFDAADGALVEVILGINYHKVAKVSLSKSILRNTGKEVSGVKAQAVGEQAATTLAPPSVSSPTMAPATGPASSLPTPPALPAQAATPNQPSAVASSVKPPQPKSGDDGKMEDVTNKIRVMLADISGLEPEEISDDAELAAIGVDSLMGMEVARELGGLFGIVFSVDDLMSIVKVSDLLDFTWRSLSLGANGSTSVSTSKGSVTDEPTNDSGANSTANVTDSESDSESWASVSGELKLDPLGVRGAIAETKNRTDQFLADFDCPGYLKNVLPSKTQLCIALAVEAFEQLGCHIASARPGDVLAPIRPAEKQQKLLDHLYLMLEREAGLIKVDVASGVITRTSAQAPAQHSKDLVADLLERLPGHTCALRITYFTGQRLAEILTGDCDGIALIFGTTEGRELVKALYADYPLNQVANAQMADIVRRIICRIGPDGFRAAGGPLRITELGAGTGGTTEKMIDLLATLDAPVEYTFTDLGPSFVAAARKKWKHHAFMRFRAQDIERPPPKELVASQHIVIASNAVHATRSLEASTGHIRKMLRDDGVVLMMEMTTPMYWVDLIFGVFEGWWLFEDGRTNAVTHQSVWQRAMLAAGFGEVDWTDGETPEIKLERVIIGLASTPPGGAVSDPTATSPRYACDVPPPMTVSLPPPATFSESHIQARKIVVDKYIYKHTEDWVVSNQASALEELGISFRGGGGSSRAVVVVTGTTGSLGALIVAHLASLAEVQAIYCLNRPSTTAGPLERQRRAFAERGISLPSSSLRKLRVLAADTRAPLLGLDADLYEEVASTLTHLVHNAWPMTGNRPVGGLAGQFKVMRNLIDLANTASGRQPPGSGRITFQFISSIATVGHYPYAYPGQIVVPEERMEMKSVLPNGYGDAKYVCERMLDETLHKHPQRFVTMAVRPGQIAGSRVSGHWNSNEHLPFLLKSAQTLGVFPGLVGDMCWTPVEDVAGAVCDLLLLPGSGRTPYPIYHIDNPVRQPWKDVIPVLTRELGIQDSAVVPFQEWVDRVRSFEGPVQENPAKRLVEFLDQNFLRMSCGGLYLGTAHACEHSTTLAARGPVEGETIVKYIDYWKSTGFLQR